MPNTVKITLSTTPVPSKLAGAIVVLMQDDRKLGKFAKALDAQLDGRLVAALKSAPRFKGKAGQQITILAPGGKISRVVLLGAGTPKNQHDWNVLGGHAYGAIAMSGDTTGTLIADDAKVAELNCLVIGASMKSYRFDKYKTTLDSDDKPSLKTLTIAAPTATAAKKELARAMAIAEGIAFTRDMGQEPPNVFNPITAAQTARQQLSKLGIKVTVIDDKQMKKLGMGCLLAVGSGSETPPRLVIMEYRGAKNKKAAPLALVGKGITHDSGGINIKLDMDSLHMMRYDMMGAAGVMGAIYALAKRKAKVNIVAAAAFAENSVDEDSFRPSDILTSMAGITVDVWNTDAEGRLVLCDAMWYVQTKYNPHTLIDMATLTGAATVALGNEYAALCSNDDALAARLHDMGNETGDKCWRLPCTDEYDKYLKSTFADVRNVGTGKGGGVITAARFLHKFVKKGVKWAHIDMANTKLHFSDSPLGPIGPTGYGVRLFDQLVATHYEDKK